MREKFITRTITEVIYTVMTVNVIESKVENRSFYLYDDLNDDKALKVLQKTYEHESMKIVSIIDKKVREKLYGMTEDTFVTHAVELDPTTRKPIA